MKLNHEEFLAFVAIKVRESLPLCPWYNGDGKIVLSTFNNGKEFQLIINQLSFYSDYRYMWE